LSIVGVITQPGGEVCIIIRKLQAYREVPSTWLWCALKAAGIIIQASWIHADFNRNGSEPTSDAWKPALAKCISEGTLLAVRARGESRSWAV
jgi:hypothetical protein